MPIPKILIADDDRDILKLITMSLQRAGYEVMAANNGSDAIKLAHEHRPDLLILDINMPAGGGLDVQNRIQEFGTLCFSPVIYLTGDKTDQVLSHATDMGAFSILYKPLDTALLMATVRRGLQQCVAVSPVAE